MEPNLVDLYKRWLFEVRGAGNYALADELLAADLVDHNAVPGPPAGRAGDVWAAPLPQAARLGTRRKNRQKRDSVSIEMV